MTLYILLMLSALPVWTQGRVSGWVRDSTGGVLPFVNVGIVGTSVGTTSDARGHYELAVGSTDSVTLRFSHTGYLVVERRLKVEGRTSLDVRMRPVAQMLEGVEVVDDKTRQSTFTSIDVQKLDDAVGPAGGVESIIKLLPDVQSNNEMSSQYSVRGGSFDENLVYINGVEVMRPMLIRSAQQEGMSIINPDLVSYILFSPGGFDATYGDKLSSVLDITYSRPTAFAGKASLSLLGGSASVQGPIGEKWDYAVGLRQHSNNYVLGGMDTKGSYTTSYTDVQALLGFHPTERWDVGAMLIWTRNVYGLVPESQTTSFGGFFNPMTIRIYFDGQEVDSYNTILGALTANYRPDDDWRFDASVSVQHLNERERYDVQDQYWLYEVALDSRSGDTAQFDRGVGTFLEHARNRLSTMVYNFDLRATRYASLGSWQAGVKVQGEHFVDHLREWRWVDSAGYALPTDILPYGDSSNYPQNPILQQFINADNTLSALRGGAFLQRDVNFSTASGAEVRLVAGVRGQLYNTDSHTRGLISPRISASYKPGIKHDMLFRLAAGIYQQSPLYREYRRADGSLQTDLHPQTAYQMTGTVDWRFRMWQKSFSLTTDIYYKYLTHLIPYTVDNLRLLYEPDLEAVGYATGISIRLNGELVEGLESWASVSLMQTQENILGDTLGWLPRPTDQRFSFKLFLQDNMPTIPWWRMSLSLIYGSGTPISVPNRAHQEPVLRLPSYYRVDWGNTVQLLQFEKIRSIPMFRHLKDIQIGVEIFNLFNFRNVVSYLWVSDYDGRPFRVPNYLTARQVNVKLTVLF